MSTVTPAGGATVQGQQVASMSDILKSITSAPQPVVQQASDAAQNAVGTLTQGQKPYEQGVAQQATQQLVNPLYDQQDRLQKAFSMYLADPQLAQKYASASGGGTGSMSPYSDPALMAGAAANQNTLATTNYNDQQNAGNLGVNGPNMGSLQANTPFTTPVNPYLGDPSAVVNNAANAPQAPSTTTGEMGTTLKGQNQLIEIMNNLITSEKGMASDVTKRKSAEYQGKLDALSYWAQTLGQELKARNELALRGGVGTDAFNARMNDQIAVDAQSGMTLDQIMKKYGTQMKHDDILKTYNDYSSWGPAKEGRDVLGKKFGVSKTLMDSMGIPLSKSEVKLSSADMAKVVNTKATLSTIQKIRDGMDNDPKLNAILGNPLEVHTFETIYKNIGPAAAQKAFGLNTKGMEAVSAFTQLQGQGDRDMIGGRLSGYMLSLFGPSFPGLGQMPLSNLGLLTNLEDRLVGGADAYAKNYQLSGWQDLPGMEGVKIGNSDSGGTVRMKSPDGKVYEWKAGDKEIDTAKQNGYQPL